MYFRPLRDCFVSIGGSLPGFSRAQRHICHRKTRKTLFSATFSAIFRDRDFFSANLISVIGIAADLGFLAVQLYEQWVWQKKYSKTQSQRNNIEFGIKVPEGP